MSTELMTMPAMEERLTAAEIKANVQLIQQVLEAVMKKDVHYGVIPGTDKPTLLKPGSEKILSTFKLGVDPQVEDLSIPGQSARYRVIARIIHQPTGMYLGAGVGECSSEETKYAWRSPVCDQEYDSMPEDCRRVIWKRGKDEPYAIQQVKTNPADQANTILKMAKKRAQIDGTLTVTAASDVFNQDLEETADDPADQRVKATEPTRQSEQGGNQTVRTVVMRVTEKTGTNAKGPFTNYKAQCKDGKQYSTFKKEVADVLRQSADGKLEIQIDFKVTEYGRNIVTAQLVQVTSETTDREPGAEG